VGVADCYQGAQYVVPGPGRQHDRVGEHATVPADVLVGPGRGSGFIAHPETCDGYDIHFSFWIADYTVAAGLVVRAGATNGAVVLGYMEVDGPGPESMRHFA